MSDDLMDPELIDTGGELFRQTDAEFEWWFADAYGISPQWDPRMVKNMSVERAKEIGEELIDIAEHCEQYQDQFPDLREDA